MQDIINALIATTKADFNKAALPLLANFFSSVAKDPSALNLIAQFALLQAGLIATIPAIEKDILANIAAEINTLAQAALAPKA